MIQGLYNVYYSFVDPGDDGIPVQYVFFKSIRRQNFEEQME